MADCEAESPGNIPTNTALDATPQKLSGTAVIRRPVLKLDFIDESKNDVSADNTIVGSETGPGHVSGRSSRGWTQPNGVLLPFDGRDASARNRSIVGMYDTQRSMTLRAHEEFKRAKWGEDRFAEFEIKTEELEYFGGFSDLLRNLGADSSNLAQCVRSYSNALGALLRSPQEATDRQTSRDGGDDKVSAGITRRNSNSELFSASSGRNGLPRQDERQLSRGETTDGVGAAAPTAVDEPQQQPAALSFVGDVAVPRAVQEVFDIASAVTSGAGKLVNAILGRDCPRRATIDLDITYADLSCPRRAAGAFIAGLAATEGSTTDESRLREQRREELSMVQTIGCPRRRLAPVAVNGRTT